MVQAKATQLWNDRSSLTTLVINTALKKKKRPMSISIFQGEVGLKGESGAPGIPGEKVCWFATLLNFVTVLSDCIRQEGKVCRISLVFQGSANCGPIGGLPQTPLCMIS